MKYNEYKYEQEGRISTAKSVGLLEFNSTFSTINS